MKTLIILSTILAAGTFAANAATTIDTSSWKDVALTLASNSNNAATETDGKWSLTGGRANSTSFAIEGNTIASPLSSEDYNWQLSFKVTKIENTTSNLVFTTGGGGYGSGYGIRVKKNDSNYEYELVYGSESVTSKTLVNSVSSTGTISVSSLELVTLTWLAFNEKLILSVGSSTSLEYTGLTKSDLNLATGSSISTGAPSGTIFWTNGAANPLTDISLKVLAVPEPSAFGLFAGLGALALAGTRRRRR